MTVCTCVKSVKQRIAVREHAGSANHPRINNHLNLDIAIEDFAEKTFLNLSRICSAAGATK